MEKIEIPMMFCFDNNYVIPAAVAFYSLLENANKNYFYKLYVLHTDISVKNQKKLKENIKEFSEFSELIFVNMGNRFEDLWDTISTKGHFSKEVMYKVLVASIFPNYEKIIVSDVDVVFLNDISQSYFDLDVNEDYYLSGVKMIGKMQWYLDQYLDRFSKEEVEKLGGFCGGYIIFNLKKLREDNMEAKFVECFQKECNRINQMEQDILNLCCYPKTKKMPLRYLTCSYMWDKYKSEEDECTDSNYTQEEIKDAMTNTVQLHYATSVKPWKDVDCAKSDIWFKYIVKTNFLKDYLNELPDKIVIHQDRLNKIKEEIKKEVVSNNKNSQYSLKSKVKRKFGNTKIFRIFRYIKNNPLFLFMPSFYQKLYKKIKDKTQKFSLIIFDDTFPSSYSPFRYEEYMSYLKEFKSVHIFSTGYSLQALNEESSEKELIKEFELKYPEYIGKVIDRQDNVKEKIETLNNKIAIITFLQNVVNDACDNLRVLEKNKIPFMFTLYPGGGFILNNEVSDNKIKMICDSKYFRKVIVTQKLTYDYLIEKKLCPEEKIEFIYGVVTPKNILKNKIKQKHYYTGQANEILNICFIAHKYSEKGIDKGYDLFIDVAKKILKRHKNIKFHIVGEFDETDIDVEDIKDNVIFYGVRKSEWFNEFYKNMDIMISPNRPFKLSKGSFDGFPTASATEAMVNGVALLCTDELNLNIKFKDKQDLIIIKPEVDDIVDEIENLYTNPQKIKSIGLLGRKKVKKYYSNKYQVISREKLIKQLAREYKK